MREWARLSAIENNHEITKKTDSQFLFEYQRAVLLALKETGGLTEGQYRCAEERLRQQLQTYLNRREERGAGPC